MLKATNRKLTGSEKRQIKAVIRRARSGHGNRVSAQQTIPYQRMYPDGVCRMDVNRYNKTIQFQDINYQLSENEDKDAIFGSWCEFINYFDSSVSFEFSFLNLENGQSVVIIRSLVNVSSPAASLILVLDRNVFNRSIRKLGDGALRSVQMRNADGNVLFQTYREAEGYELTVASGILPASYRMVYAPPSEVRNRYGVVNLAFCGTLLLALALGVTTAYLLSLHNLRPLNKLLNTINRLLGDAPDRPAEDSEFDRIESSFAELYAQ